MNKGIKITIIGGGLGGLTTGALLAKNGYSVTLLEQHNIVGGCATTFKRKGGFICEVGLHEMEGVYTNPQIKKIFNQLDIYNHITFVKPNEFFSITTQNGNFIMPDGLTKAQQKLIEAFPHEQKGIKRYFKLISTVSNEFETLQNASWYHYTFFPFLFLNILRYKNKSVTHILNKILKDDKLKLILNANIQYYNDTPDTLSFLLHSVAQNSYFNGGGWFIKGGSQKLSNYLAKVITDNSGTIITSANVIKCDKNQVVYIHKKQKKSLQTDIFVSNIAPCHTYKLFDTAYTETKEIANSLLSIYFGFKKNLKAVYGSNPYSHFIFEQIDSIDSYNTMLKQDISKRGFVFVDYSQIDAALTKDPNKSFAVACWSDYIEEWQGLDEDIYCAKKEALIDTTLNKLEKYYPNIKELVEYAEVGTSKTVQRYIKTPSGTAYGYKPTPKQFFKVPKVKSKKINRLYFTGQWVIAGGFSPAILSGGLCYKTIVNR